MELIINTSDGRKDKNDVILQELVNAKNWKQALANCEKRLRKGEKSDSLLVNKAHILLSFPDLPHQRQGSAELVELLDRKSPITNIDVLSAIQKAAEAREDNDPRIISMWERAIGASPGEEELYTIWFLAKFKKGDYKSAQKAAMIYQKNFSQSRQPFFWAIVSSYLAAKAPEATDTDKRLFGPLAYRLISKAASDAIDVSSQASQDLATEFNASHPSSSRSIRAIQNLGEVILLVKIFRSQDKLKEAIDILDGSELGLISGISAKSWDLVLGKIELYGLCKRWKEQWSFCYGLLQDAHGENILGSNPTSLGFGRFGDDWKVWKGLLDATAKIHKPDNCQLTNSLIDAYLAKSVVSHNARLALIACSEIDVSNRNGRNLFTFSCIDYFSHYSSKSMCFSGLSSYVYRLEADQQSLFLSHIAQRINEFQPSSENDYVFRTNWVLSEINVLKLDYSLVVSREENFSNVTLLEAFISNCLRLYRISRPIGLNLPVSERRPGDDAAILAAMGCVHLWKSGHRLALVRCAVILEVLLSESKHNYDALLIIIRVYLCLGAVTRAWEFYERLDVKNMQYQSTAWILFTRISTIHPHPIKDRANANIIKFHPASAIEEMLRWILKNEKRLRSGVTMFLENDAYINLLDHLKTTESLEQSPCKGVLICEFWRIHRLGYCSRAPGCDLMTAFHHLKPGAEDARQTSIYPSYEAHGQARFEERIRPGPMPSARWVGRQARTLLLDAVLNGDLTVQYDDVLLSSMSSDLGTTDEETEDERNADNVAALLFRLIVLATSTTDKYGDDNTARTLFREIETSWSIPVMKRALLINQNPEKAAFELPGVTVPHWNFFHQIYTWIDTCQIIKAALKVIVEGNGKSGRMARSWLETKMVQLCAECDGICLNSFNTADEIHQQLDSQRAVRNFTEVCIGRTGDTTDNVGTEIQTLVDRVWMERLSEDLLASWKEALDGISQMTMRA